MQASAGRFGSHRRRLIRSGSKAAAELESRVPFGDVEDGVKTGRDEELFQRRSYRCIPFVPLILPISASPSANVLQALDQFDPHDIFCMLIAELVFDAEPQGRTMGDGEHLVVHP